MPALILSQLRWLDHVVKGKVSPACLAPLVLYLWVWCDCVRVSCSMSQDLCRKLLEVMGVAPVEIQREIVTAIPEILDDAEHNDAAMELK